MRNSIIISALLFIGYTVIKKRYRVLNSILRNPLVRRLAVRFAMQIPFIRQQFMGQAFR
jgi:hypothetical protein